jgi:hypothetical protein
MAGSEQTEGNNDLLAIVRRSITRTIFSAPLVHR